MQVDHLIIGAGPTGLGAARRLAELGCKSFLVLEKNDFSAIFRKKGHKHYKNCSDPVLDAFLKGIEAARA